MRPRPSVSGEAQAAELRARARRRLAGSVVLVLAAVIILPMVLDSRPIPVADDIPVRIPERDAPYQPAVSEPQTQPPVQQQAPAPAAPMASAPAPAPVAPPTLVPTPAAPSPVPAPSRAAPPPVALAPVPVPEAPRPSAKPAESKPESKPATRTDDGSVALALLEGRKPAASAPAVASKTPASAAKGSGFVLQIAAYGSQSDAQARNDQLREKGVTNTYVEQVNSGGKVLYRLRVGPFASREVAQAQQARLRALGYDAVVQ